MCLNFLKPLEEKGGYALKVVRRIPDKLDEFHTLWPRFDVNGGGGRGGVSPKKGEVVSGLVYKIGRTYRVKHNRQALSGDAKNAYPALVHCYKETKRAIWEDNRPRGTTAFIIVKYSGGQYQDQYSLTAKYVTPIMALEDKVFDKFRKKEAEVGFKAAVESLLAAKFWMED